MGKTDIWMPIYIGDYLGDTQHLSAEKHGIYLLLMMHYWIHGPLENDIEEISFVARSTEENVKKILEKFFKLESGHWKHGRIEKEKVKATARSKSASANSKKRWDMQRQCDGISDSNAGGDTKPMRNGCSSPSPLQLQSKTHKDKKGEPKRTSRFVPPTIEEVNAYCLERKNTVNAQKFFDYYEALDWHKGNGEKVKRWKGSVISWEGRDYSGNSKKSDTYNTEMNFEL